MSRPPTQEQSAGINARNRNLLLEAGAGTGKTTVMVSRYCDRIEFEELATDQILAFTFTEKAAVQLRRRIRLELAARASSCGDPETKARLERVVADFGGSWVTTIHGFCRRLLASHPVAAGIDPAFRVLDASESERASRRAFARALDEFTQAENIDRDEIVAAYGADGLRTTIRDAFGQMRAEGDTDPRLPEVVPADLPRAIAELIRCAEVALAEGKPAVEQRLRIERALELALGFPGQMPEIDQLALMRTDSKKEAVNNCSLAVEKSVKAIAENDEGVRVHAHLAELLELFARHYREVKEERSGLDFEDLQLLSLDLLREHPAIRDRYRGRLVEVMVDEFQDTNRMQLELVGLLQGPETSVFSVGDEFQSIYGFRNADIEVFREQRRQLRADENGQVLPLSGNFRSRPEVIAAANRFAGSLLPEFRELKMGSPDQGGPPPTDGGEAVELLVSDEKGWDKDALGFSPDSTTPISSMAEARFLAGRLRGIVDSGDSEAGEIVILLRSYTHVDAYETALEEVGLRPYVIGGSGYWSHQQAGDLLAILNTIANPLDDEALLGAMASPACAASPDALWLLRRAAGRGRHLWPAVDALCGDRELEEEAARWAAEIPATDLEGISRLHAVVTELRRVGTRIGLEQLIDRTIAETGYDVAVLIRPPGAVRMANLRKLLRLAREYESTEGRDLRGFLEYAEFGAEIDREASAATEVEGHDGVRIMTIHKAKGLEFPVVAVPGLGRKLLIPDSSGLSIERDRDGRWHTAMKLKRVGSPPIDLYESAELKAEGKERESEEELRLFYVAMTRAERRLILSSVAPSSSSMNRTTENTPVISRLLTGLGHGEAPVEERLPIGSPLPRPDLSADFPEASLLIRVNAAPDPDRQDHRAPELAARAGPGSPAPVPVLAATTTSPPLSVAPMPPPPLPALSYSALGAYERCGYRFYVERVLRIRLRAEPGDSEGAVSKAERYGFGNVVHSLLEWSAHRDWMVPTADQIADALRAEEIEPEARRVADAAGQITGWIDSSLCAELLADRARVRVEVPLLLDLAGSVLRGSIDLLHEPDSGMPTVVDFKTNRLGDRSPEEMASRYEIQRNLYALATAIATGVGEVRVAYVFLERPDDPVMTTLGEAEIAAARSDLEARVERIRGGDFAATKSPDWPLCHDCPARRRLCPGPAAQPAN